MNELFRITLPINMPESKFKYLLLNEPLEKISGKIYEDYVFQQGKKIEIANELVIGKSWGKKFADFHMSLGGAFYINEKFINCLKTVGETNYQLLPITVLPEEKPYFILNTLNVIDCVDRELSKFTLWTEEDNRPDKLGKFHGFDKMVLDRTKVPNGVHIFLLKGYDILTVVTKELVEEFEKNDVKGFTLIPVG